MKEVVPTLPRHDQLIANSKGPPQLRRHRRRHRRRRRRHCRHVVAVVIIVFRFLAPSVKT